MVERSLGYRASASRITTLTKLQLVRVWFAILDEPRLTAAFADPLDMENVFDHRRPGLR